jgi:hypothetical protein
LYITRLYLVSGEISCVFEYKKYEVYLEISTIFPNYSVNQGFIKGIYFVYRVKLLFIIIQKLYRLEERPINDPRGHEVKDVPGNISPIKIFSH